MHSEGMDGKAQFDSRLRMMRVALHIDLIEMFTCAAIMAGMMKPNITLDIEHDV